MKKRSILKVLFASIVVVTVSLHFILITTDAFSRAGRGGSYRSSSSSSSRSYSSSSSRSSSSSWGRSSSGSSSSSRTYIPYGTSHSSSSSSSSGTSDSSSTSSENDWIYGLIGLVIIFGGIGLVIYFIIRFFKKIFGIGGGAAKAGFDDSAPTQYEFNPALAEKLRTERPGFFSGKIHGKGENHRRKAPAGVVRRQHDTGQELCVTGRF